MELLFFPINFLLLYTSTCAASDNNWIEEYKKLCVGADVPYYVDDTFPRCCPCSPCEDWSRPVLECYGNGEDICVSKSRRCVYQEEFDEVFRRPVLQTSTPKVVRTFSSRNTTALSRSTPTEKLTNEIIEQVPMTSVTILVMGVLIAVTFTSCFLVLLYKFRKRACFGNAVEKLNKIVPRCFQKSKDEPPESGDQVECELLESHAESVNTCKVEEVKCIRENAQQENLKPYDDINGLKQESLSITKESIEEPHDKVPPVTRHPELPYDVNRQQQPTSSHHVIHAMPHSNVHIGSLRVVINGDRPPHVNQDSLRHSHEDSHMYAPSSFSNFSSSSSRHTPPGYESAVTDVPIRATHVDRPIGSETVTSRAPRVTRGTGPRQHDEGLHMQHDYHRSMFRQSSTISSTSTKGAVVNDDLVDDYQQPRPQHHQYVRTRSESHERDTSNFSCELDTSLPHRNAYQQRNEPDHRRQDVLYRQERHGARRPVGYEVHGEPRNSRAIGNLRIQDQTSNYVPANHGGRADFQVCQNTYHGRSESPNLYQSTTRDTCESTPHYSQEESQNSVPILRPPGDGNYSDRC